MSIERLVNRVAAYQGKLQKPEAKFTVITDNLLLITSKKPTPLKPDLYTPVLCLILQGRKETRIGKNCIEFGAGESLIVSHTSPVYTRITEASADAPYLALVLTLDIDLLTAVYSKMSRASSKPASSNALSLGEPDELLNDAMYRLLVLVEQPFEHEILAPLVQREIHFRLLMAEHGSMLRQLVTRDSHANRISRAIYFIQENYNKPLPVSIIAEVAGMSVSSFHEHFKSITGSTPLQYQKDLRLLEAQRHLQFQGQSVSETAYSVGYESATQFSREYSRKFGKSPSEDRRSGETTF
jgi:AraC-like DNA-binding protein